MPSTTAPPVCSGAVAIIASAGGIAALQKLLAGLPRNFPWPVLIAQHLSPMAPSVLAGLLARRSPLDVLWAEPNVSPRPGTVYLARPGCRLEASTSGFVVTPLEKRHSAWLTGADALFRSVAATYGSGAIGIVLSGMMAAGVEGLRAIRRAGGLVLAESEVSAEHFSMPMSAIDLGRADIVYPVSRMAEALVAFAEFQGLPRVPAV
jgi:two-component system chemotaxis response regulator CheB